MLAIGSETICSYVCTPDMTSVASLIRVDEMNTVWGRIPTNRPVIPVQLIFAHLRIGMSIIFAIRVVIRITVSYRSMTSCHPKCLEKLKHSACKYFETVAFFLPNQQPLQLNSQT